MIQSLGATSANSKKTLKWDLLFLWGEAVFILVKDFYFYFCFTLREKIFCWNMFPLCFFPLIPNITILTTCLHIRYVSCGFCITTWGLQEGFHAQFQTAMANSIRSGCQKTVHLAPNKTNASDCYFSGFSSCISPYPCRVSVREAAWKAVKCALIQSMTLIYL